MSFRTVIGSWASSPIDKVAAVVSVLALAPAIAAVFFGTPDRNQDDLQILQLSRAVEAARLAGTASRQVAELGQQVAQLQKQTAILGTPSAESALAAQVIGINERVSDISRRQARLEQVLLTTPEKALTLPLLRKDIDAQKEATAQAISAVRSSVDQVYDLNKWLIGSMAVAVLLLALSTFFRLHQAAPGRSTDPMD